MFLAFFYKIRMLTIFILEPMDMHSVNFLTTYMLIAGTTIPLIHPALRGDMWEEWLSRVGGSICSEKN
jgi:hypothetical protein